MRSLEDAGALPAVGSGSGSSPADAAVRAADESSQHSSSANSSSSTTSNSSDKKKKKGKKGKKHKKHNKHHKKHKKEKKEKKEKEEEHKAPQGAAELLEEEAVDVQSYEEIQSTVQHSHIYRLHAHAHTCGRRRCACHWLALNCHARAMPPCCARQHRSSRQSTAVTCLCVCMCR
jgi:flagellum-specific peptidoglycan hydrolase FlgJ